MSERDEISHEKLKNFCFYQHNVKYVNVKRKFIWLLGNFVLKNYKNVDRFVNVFYKLATKYHLCGTKKKRNPINL